jgi:biotin transport system substrate-specific component
LSTAASVSTRPGLVLADAIPGTWTRDIALVLGGALLTCVGALISIHVPGSPVPVTGQTLAVVVAGASLGMRRGAASQLLYLVLGLFLPVYADGESGLDVVWGASGGYIVGFVIAAAIVGYLAEQGADRKPVVAFLAFCAGQLAIFGIGVPWLKVAADMSWGDAIHFGFTVFILGGVIKALVGAGAVPAAWRFVKRLDEKHV